jgi:hypothetical protein
MTDQGQRVLDALRDGREVFRVCGDRYHVGGGLQVGGKTVRWLAARGLVRVVDSAGCRSVVLT